MLRRRRVEEVEGLLPMDEYYGDLLVIEDDVWEPDPLAGHVQGLHPAVLHRVPLQLVVVPRLGKAGYTSSAV